MKVSFNKTYFVLATTLLVVEIAIALFLKTGFIRHTFGDYLVVILIYCSIKTIVNAKPIKTAITTLIFAFIVELLQLTPLLEFLNLQNNTLAKIIVGTTFNISDLGAYVLGIITVIIIEKTS
ncbi:ribosomal maturation YjgA family protein [Aestuariibaculum sediminum]|uniref:DUF2809 domain-containing protein n=1 Tax=Aestuariibaculum sediminum TaxID=2770637 RepID=A0A8J6Q5C6_9FLAO|nr:DUF2809 domain-containing protein [Aestuariibaculum sediminum]MBD0830568.1 DUF2809 domain-containing protein [Aestuariibaculum sediminum]